MEIRLRKSEEFCSVTLRFSKEVFSQKLFDHADVERRTVPLQQHVKWAAKFQNKISQGKDLTSKGTRIVDIHFDINALWIKFH